MPISSDLEMLFSCKKCGFNMVLVQQNVVPKKTFGDEVGNAKVCLIKKAMVAGWLFDTKDCTCPQCRTDKGKN